MHHLKKEISLLTGLGVILLLGGLSVGIYFLGFFDTSVQVPDQEILGQDIGGEMVNNIGLMSEQQEGINLGFGAAFVGLALVCFERYADKKKGK